MDFMESKRKSRWYVMICDTRPYMVREFEDRYAALVFMDFFESSTLLYGSVLHSCNNLIVKEVSAKD